MDFGINLNKVDFSPPKMKRIGLCAVLLCIVFSFYRSLAQQELVLQLTLSSPQIDDFPLIDIGMKAFSSERKFIHGLSLSEVQLYENGNVVSLQTVSEQRVGVQGVFVLNPGEVFLARDPQGFTRYDYLLDGLVDWSRRRLGSTIDDLSIVVADGPSRSHLTNSMELFYTLASYRIPQEAIPTLDSLFKGIEIASDPTPRYGMERVVVFITAPLSGDQSIAIQNAIQQARQNGVRVYIWCLTTPATANPQAISALRPLAEGTQGDFWVLTKPEEQPDPETIFMPLRDIYILRYFSSPEGGNDREIEAEVKIGETRVRSEPIAFRTNLQPPNIAFVAPPVEILRQPPEDGSDRSLAPETFEPQAVQFNLIIEFPDGRQRSIVKMRIYVDQQLIFEQQDPPFDSFTWDLRGITQTSQHILQVEVVDELGMSAKTVPIPILVKVSRPLPTPSKIVSRNLPLIGLSLAAVLFASVVLALAMRGSLIPTSQRLSRRLSLPRKRPVDPLTQPIPVPSMGVSKRQNPAIQVHKPRNGSESNPPVFARLYRLGKTDWELSGPFAIVTEELKIGSDTIKNQLVIDDPTVASTHACLTRQRDGNFRLQDLGSLMGTWVNYTPVSQEGVLLKDGDVIHIGRVGFRFRLRQGSKEELLTQSLEEKH
ncbi:MAG: FHA domain-containing protein [Anaerolineales bacterium]|nr:FHA domain-containing protein [Anaerolineales bacterium]